MSLQLQLLLLEKLFMQQEMIAYYLFVCVQQIQITAVRCHQVLMIYIGIFGVGMVLSRLMTFRI